MELPHRILKPSFTLFGAPDRLEDGKIVVIGVPLEDTVSFRPGTRFSPSRLRHLSTFIELSPTVDLGIDVESRFCDVGDVALVQGDVIRNLKIVSDTVRQLTSMLKRSVLLCIGGEHTITYATHKALSMVNSKPALICLDSHLDLRDEWPPGQRYSHATFLRRLVEEREVSYVLHLGSHAYSPEEVRFAMSLDNFVMVSASVIKRSSRYEIRSLIRDFVESVSGPIHVSVDVDVVRSSSAPGVSNPECCGLDYHDVYNIIESIADYGCNRVKMYDIVEYSPYVDVSDITGVLVLKLITDIANLSYVG